MQTIDMTPTWGEWGNVFLRFVESSELKAAKTLFPDAKKAFAAAQALQSIMETLTPEQHEQVRTTMATELAKQGE